MEEKPPGPDAGNSTSVPATFLLEAENSSLRRLVVELLEKNQQLREQVRVLGGGRNPEITGELTAHPSVDRRGVDPRAA